MVTTELSSELARLIVIVGAAVAAALLLRRSANRRRIWVIAMGMVLAVVPIALNAVQAMSPWDSPLPLTVLSLLEGLGFVLILVGFMLGLHAVSRDTSKLRKQNAILKREASTDFLTGLLNRRQTDLLLDYGAARARRSGDPMGFIMVDLDHFKQVNDTLGHQAGDAVLVHVARLLQSRLRASDIVSRYGGEEFLVALADTSPKAIVTVAEDLRRLIEGQPAEYDGRPVPVTASFGVALGLVDTEEEVRECIGKADAALYMAKATGRNRVVAWEQVMHAPAEPAGQQIQPACASAPASTCAERRAS